MKIGSRVCAQSDEHDLMAYCGACGYEPCPRLPRSELAHTARTDRTARPRRNRVIDMDNYPQRDMHPLMVQWVCPHTEHHANWSRCHVCGHESTDPLIQRMKDTAKALRDRARQDIRDDWMLHVSMLIQDVAANLDKDPKTGDIIHADGCEKPILHCRCPDFSLAHYVSSSYPLGRS